VPVRDDDLPAKSRGHDLPVPRHHLSAKSRGHDVPVVRGRDEHSRDANGMPNGDYDMPVLRRDEHSRDANGMPNGGYDMPILQRDKLSGNGDRLPGDGINVMSDRRHAVSVVDDAMPGGNYGVSVLNDQLSAVNDAVPPPTDGLPSGASSNQLLARGDHVSDGGYRLLVEYNHDLSGNCHPVPTGTHRLLPSEPGHQLPRGRDHVSADQHLLPGPADRMPDCPDELSGGWAGADGVPVHADRMRHERSKPMPECAIERAVCGEKSTSRRLQAGNSYQDPHVCHEGPFALLVTIVSGAEWETPEGGRKTALFVGDRPQQSGDPRQQRSCKRSPSLDNGRKCPICEADG
jgi:hypothetical protein